MPTYPSDIIEEIRKLQRRVERLERQTTTSATFVDEDGNPLFTVNQEDTAVGFFGHLVTAPATSPATLADVIQVLKNWGLSS